MRGSQDKLSSRAKRGICWPGLQMPAEENETNAAQREKEPVVHRDVHREVAYVVDAQDQMIDRPLDQIEHSPTQNQEPGKGLRVGQQTSATRVGQEPIQ